MARRKLRQFRPQNRKKSRKKTTQAVRETAAATPPAPIPTSLELTKQDIVSKLIPLSVPSAKDAQKKAEKATENVLAAIVHVLGEGDLTIEGFGDFKAAKDAKSGGILVSFIASEKLKQAVEARLNPRP